MAWWLAFKRVREPRPDRRVMNGRRRPLAQRLTAAQLKARLKRIARRKDGTRLPPRPSDGQ